MAVAAQQNVVANEARAGAAQPSRAVIAFDRVSIAFDSLVVLEDVSFSILPGRLTRGKRGVERGARGGGGGGGGGGVVHLGRVGGGSRGGLNM